MNKVQVKRVVVLTIISVAVSFAAFLQIAKHSTLRPVEVLIILVLGMGIAALIFNIANFCQINKKE